MKLKHCLKKKNEGCSQAENLLAEINLGCVIANKNKKQEAYLAILGSLLFNTPFQVAWGWGGGGGVVILYYVEFDDVLKNLYTVKVLMKQNK